MRDATRRPLWGTPPGCTFRPWSSGRLAASLAAATSVADREPVHGDHNSALERGPATFVQPDGPYAAPLVGASAIPRIAGHRRNTRTAPGTPTRSHSSASVSRAAAGLYGIASKATRPLRSS